MERVVRGDLNLSGMQRQAPQPDRAAYAFAAAPSRICPPCRSRPWSASFWISSWAGRELDRADIVAELRTRFAFLREVGLPYLALDRAAPTLSGGEAQARLRRNGSNLRGVCYILDERRSGFTRATIASCSTTLAKLEAKGNTLLVVEHDKTQSATRSM